MNFLKSALAGAGLLLAAMTSANAAPIFQGTATSLTGINDLVVDGTSYNVTFVDGTCASVFGTCDAAHFTFDQTGALDAALALYVAIHATYFDTNVGTAGCPDPTLCAVIIPYALGTPPFLFTAVFQNGYALADATQLFTFATVTDTSTDGTFVYAVFTPGTVSAVPEPVTLSLFGAGVGALALLRRRRKSRGR